MLPHTAAALTRRFPSAVSAIEQAAGNTLGAVVGRIGERAGPRRLRDWGVDRDALAPCADAALQRPELALTPPVPDRDELLALYEAAW
jgi:alcohol dehydrogenase class IV